MQLVHDALVQSRFSNTFPRTVEMLCPHCLKEAVFEASTWQEHGRQVAASELECARCEREVLFIQLLESDGTRKDAGLFCHPGPGGREAMAGVDHLQSLAAPLARSYESALKLYNRAEWGASSLVVRHLLGGLAARMLAEDKGDLSLSRKLEALQQDVDLSRPLQDVAQLLAPGGTFGRQFEDEATIDKATAELLLELAEQLITYLVVLPGTMSDLKARIATAPVPLRRGSGAA
ncbi:MULTISPECIES: hypothetical protein [unclassified Lysobacter]|uniref:hypothetical protein n=1 Tax=unclassified Lysobacter TaxID=2635362 RepID=UPI001C210D49|nr:hypothetical protein [Lysobacter sp. MMG2]MBU8975681.1 hypothetical protein [Lysobacter sp. MMG2]